MKNTQTSHKLELSDVVTLVKFCFLQKIKLNFEQMIQI